MAVFSFVGRVLFVSAFILSAWQEYNDFGSDGGPAARALEPKLDHASKYMLSQTDVQLPDIEAKHLVAAAIALKGFGSLLFVFAISSGAYLLLLHQAMAAPILYDFYNYDSDKEEFSNLFAKFTQSLALFGALLFFIGMKDSTTRRRVKKKAPKRKTM